MNEKIIQFYSENKKSINPKTEQTKNQKHTNKRNKYRTVQWLDITFSNSKIEIVTERNNFIMTDCRAKMSSSIKIL